MIKLSNLKLRYTITRLNRLDPEKADYEYIKRTYNTMLPGLGVIINTTKSTEMFFRTRVNPSSKPSKIEEVAAPPAKFIKGYQRCNPPSKPMFYTASKRLTSILECNVQKGDTIYLSQWMGKGKLPINGILDENALKEANFTYSEHETTIHTYFDTLFTRRIHSKFSSDYKFTSAATEVMTTNFTPGDYNIQTDKTVGLRYPSVHDIQNSYNTVWHTEISESMFEIIHLLEARVTKAQGHDIELEVIDTAVNFNDGKIHWLGDPTQLPEMIPDKSRVPFIKTDSGWTLPIRDKTLTANEMSSFLNE